MVPLLASALMMPEPGSTTAPRKRKQPDNGFWRHSHKENVKRKRVRRMQKASRKANR